MYINGTAPSWVVAEIWNSMAYGGDGKPLYNQDPHRQALVDWVDKVGGTASPATVFDFTTKGILNAAVEGELWRLIDPQAGFTISVGKTEISDIFPTSATHREANFGPESG